MDFIVADNAIIYAQKIKSTSNAGSRQTGQVCHCTSEAI